MGTADCALPGAKLNSKVFTSRLHPPITVMNDAQRELGSLHDRGFFEMITVRLAANVTTLRFTASFPLDDLKQVYYWGHHVVNSNTTTLAVSIQAANGARQQPAITNMAGGDVFYASGGAAGATTTFAPCMPEPLLTERHGVSGTQVDFILTVRDFNGADTVTHTEMLFKFAVTTSPHAWKKSTMDTPYKIMGTNVF